MIYCQSCSKDGKSVPAESYCTVCEEFMCSNCTRLHRNQQMSSSHALLVKESTPISIKEQSMKTDGTEPCEIHPQEVIKYFCLTHKILNCGHCLAVEHRSCDVEIISEVSNTFKDSSEYSHIKSSIAELLNNSDSCSSNIAQSIEFITKHCEDEITKLRTFRNEIHKYFERSENDLLQTIQNMKNMNEALLHSLQPKCESLKIEVQEIKSKLEAHENNTFKLFIEAKRAQKILDCLQAALADIMKRNTVQQYEFIKDPATERLLTSHIGLGVIQKKAVGDIHTCTKQEDVRPDTGSSFYFGAGRSEGTPSTTAAFSEASLPSVGESTTSTPSGSGFLFGRGSTDSAKSASGITLGTLTTVTTCSGFVSGSSTATTKAATTTSGAGLTFGFPGSSSGFEFGSTYVSVSTSSASSITPELKADVSTVESTTDYAGTNTFGTTTSTTIAGIFGGTASSRVLGAKTISEVRGLFGSSSVFTQPTATTAGKSESSESVSMGTTCTGKSAFSVCSVFGQVETQPFAFNFGQAASTDKTSDEGFKFTIDPGSDTLTSQPEASLGSGFNFSMNMTLLKEDSPTKSFGLKSPGMTSIKSSEYNEEDYYVNKESDDCNIYFKPVIALPDTVEVNTGEEDEEVVFKHRAKLFRFLNGEWKERGLGDVKILYQPNANKVRILMRRERILKICCNHYVTPDLKLQPMPNSKGAALIWSAVDFADGEWKHEKFSIKFKNQKIAEQFEKAIDDTKGKMTVAKLKIQQSVVSPKAESLVDLDDNGVDVEITKVEKATSE